MMVSRCNWSSGRSGGSGPVEREDGGVGYELGVVDRV